MLNLKDRVIQSLYERRQRILEGKINSIPSPFKRFSDDFIGIEQGKYYILTGGTKSAKTQLGSYLFIYNTLQYAYRHPDKLRLKIFYYNLEESKEDILKRFMCYLLYTKSRCNIKLSSVELSSTKSTNGIIEEALKLLDSEEYKGILDFFEKTIIFGDSANPTGIYKEVLHYIKENGTIYTQKKTVKDEFGNLKTIDSFDYYVSNDPDEYRILFIDHVSLLTQEQGFSLKQTIDKLSEYCVLLRNRYKLTPVIIQQQALAQEGLDSIKSGRMRPSLANLSDSKFTSRDGDLVLGIFSPYRFELPEYQGFNITILKDHIRFLEVLINRGGSPGGLIPLYFDGTVNYFAELPHPQKQEIELNRIYNKLSQNEVISLFMVTQTNYLLGSHNSWSYISPENRLLKPFHFTTRCQSKSLSSQYNDYGVRVFDLRVRLYNNYWYCAHGSMVFDKKAYEALEDLLEVCNSTEEKCWVRILLEYNKEPSDSIKNKFIEFCDGVENIYGGFFNLFGGRVKATWEMIYNFPYDLELDDKYSSTTTLFDVSESSWLYKPLKVIDDWIPWLYAKLKNKKLYKKGTDKECLFIDFVNIGQ